MEKQAEKYIKANRLKKSMIDMHLHLGIPLNHVRDYMKANNLMLSKDEIYKMKAYKRKAKSVNQEYNFNRKINKKDRPWNWDALL